jgi:hypothetical protein
MRGANDAMCNFSDGLGGMSSETEKSASGRTETIAV